MAFKICDRVKESTTTTGTGTITLGGAISGFRSFSTAGVANGDTFAYTLLDANGTGWETAIGTYNTGGTISRTTVLNSSNSGSAINLSSGTHTIFISAVEKYLYRAYAPILVDKGNSGTSTQTCDYTAGQFQKITNTGAHTFAFSNWPSTGNVGEMQVLYVNPGANVITWPAAINWKKPDGTLTTTFSASGIVLQSSGINLFYFQTFDGGTTVYGSVL